MTVILNNYKFFRYGYPAWIILCFLLSLPITLTYQAITGLDPSWQLAINLAIQRDFIFGKDFIFTYGPLGFLAAKYTFAVSKFAILFFELFMASCATYIAHFNYKKSGERKIILATTLVVLILLKALNLIHLIMPVFIFFVLYAIHYKSILHLIIALFLSIIGFYIKVNYGIILIFVVYSAIALCLFKKIFSTKSLLLLLFAHIILLWLSSILLKVSLSPYIVSSLHLINAYNDAMNIFTIPIQYLHFALAIISLFAIGFLLNFKYYFYNINHLFTYTLGTLFVYLLFKNGIVRADGHIFEYFHIVPTAFTLIYIFSENKAKKIWGILTLTTIVISSYALLWKIDIKPKLTTTTVKEYLSAEYLKDIFIDVSYKNKITKIQNPIECEIEKRYLTEIGNQSVDIIPWEISIAYYNKLGYNPRPVIQSYSAYDQYLDSINSLKYKSNTAPEYVLYAPMSIDGRNPIWDESITKRALMSHYELILNDTTSDIKSEFDESYYLKMYPDVANAITRGDFKKAIDHFICCGRREGRSACEKCNTTGYFLLKKREKPLKWKTINVKTKTFEFGKEYKIDSTKNNLYLYADIEYSTFGKIKRLLFQPPYFTVELKYNDGSVVPYKGIVPIMKTGVLLNKSTLTYKENKLLYSRGGTKNNSIISIKFIAENGFNKSFKATIKEMKLE